MQQIARYQNTNRSRPTRPGSGAVYDLMSGLGAFRCGLYKFIGSRQQIYCALRKKLQINGWDVPLFR